MFCCSLCACSFDCFSFRPDMTFVVDWALNNNYLSIYLVFVSFLVMFAFFVRCFVCRLVGGLVGLFTCLVVFLFLGLSGSLFDCLFPSLLFALLVFTVGCPCMLSILEYKKNPPWQLKSIEIPHPPPSP